MKAGSELGIPGLRDWSWGFRDEALEVERLRLKVRSSVPRSRS